MMRSIISFCVFFIYLSHFTLAQQPNFELKRIDETLLTYKNDFFKKLGRQTLKEVPSLASFLVWRDSGLIHEQYFNECNSNTYFQLKSVTKSIVSALAGIANDQGLLPNLQTPVLKILSEYDFNNAKNSSIWYADILQRCDSIKRTLTLKHLLTMQAGFLWNDNNPLSHRAFQTSSDPVRYMLDLPFENFPGTNFNYSTGASHLLGAVVAKCVKTDLKSFADSNLFHPLGIQTGSWTCDPLGRFAGGAELSMKALDMIKFGLLYLQEGKINGKQILSKKWILESSSEQVELNKWDVLPNANGYGYYWWRRTSNGHQAFIASGYGGQLICIIPDLKMIVVTTCLVNEKNRGRSEIKRLHLMIDKIVKVSKTTAE